MVRSFSVRCRLDCSAFLSSHANYMAYDDGVGISPLFFVGEYTGLSHLEAGRVVCLLQSFPIGLLLHQSLTLVAFFLFMLYSLI